jgi:hypothetical protein
MTTAEPATDVVYDLEGTLLEACSCGVLCPCWPPRPLHAPGRVT